MISLLFKLSLTELLQMRDLSVLKQSNMTNYITVFVTHHWKTDITSQNEQQFANILELVSRFLTDSHTNQSHTLQSSITIDQYNALYVFSLLIYLPIYFLSNLFLTMID